MKSGAKAGSLVPSRGVIVPHEHKPSQRAAAWGLFVLERLVTASLRCLWQNTSGLGEERENQPVIFCLWHNRLAISMIVRRRDSRRLAALVSASKDGALLAAVFQAFGVERVRGRFSRRGPQTLLELTGGAEPGYDLALTPDGSKGPRYVALTPDFDSPLQGRNINGSRLVE